MSLVTFAPRASCRTVLRAGVLHDDRVSDIDLAIAARGGRPVTGGSPDPALGSELLTLLGGGDRALEAAHEATDHAIKAGDVGSGTLTPSTRATTFN